MNNNFWSGNILMTRPTPVNAATCSTNADRCIHINFGQLPNRMRTQKHGARPAYTMKRGLRQGLWRRHDEGRSTS